METSRPHNKALRISRSTPSPGKTSVIAVCSGCAAVRKNGVWTWRTAPVASESRLCPACQQIADGRATATVFMPTEMVSRRRQEIFALIRNIETTEKLRNPLERIIKICDDHKSITIETTSEFIAERIAYAVGVITRATITTRNEDGRLILVIA
jgi:hypothetical protein